MKRIGYIKGQRVRELPTESIADDAVTKAKLDSAINYWKLQRSTSVLKELTGQDDIGWTDLDIDTLITVPTGAIGLIVEGYVIDTGAAHPTLFLRKKGEETNDWQWARLSAQVNGLAINNLMVVEMDDDHIIQYRLQSTANGNTAAFYLKLMGWVMKP